MLTARPQAVGHGLVDSSAGLIRWLLVQPGFAQWTHYSDPHNPSRKTRCWTASRCTGARTPAPRLDDCTGRTTDERRSVRPCRRRPRSRSRWPSRTFRRRSIAPRSHGSAAPIPTSSTFTRSTRVATSRPGSSRSSFRPSGAQHSDRGGRRAAHGHRHMPHAAPSGPSSPRFSQGLPPMGAR